MVMPNQIFHAFIIMLELYIIHYKQLPVEMEESSLLVEYFFYDSRQRRQCCWCISFVSALFANVPCIRRQAYSVRYFSRKNTDSFSCLADVIVIQDVQRKVSGG